jgi:DNA repair exonuclease SbcCD nuclease subunit
MSTIRLMGDAHIGKRFPFTTARTSLAFQELHKQTLASVFQPGLPVISLGDLFDSYHVGSADFVQGYLVANQCVATLAGNHDKNKNVEKPSALRLLFDHLGAKVAWENPEWLTQGNAAFCLVPHQATQEQFETVLRDIELPVSARTRVLCLHCNWGAHTGSIGDNYLSPAMAADLLKRFDLIVSGHEHDYHEPMPGVVMLGAILPFSFGELTKKVCMDFNTDDGTYQLVTLWEPSYTKYAGMPCESTTSPFVEITGHVDIEQMAEINKWIEAQFKLPSTIAIKNSATLRRHDRQAEDIDKPSDWTASIKAQCDEEQTAFFNEILENLA